MPGIRVVKETADSLEETVLDGVMDRMKDGD